MYLAVPSAYEFIVSLLVRDYYSYLTQASQCPSSHNIENLYSQGLSPNSISSTLFEQAAPSLDRLMPGMMLLEDSQ